ncbi:hypothetical protein B1757_08045 [Acidithiobacillus marinus]|uniref:Uncharacterized protein n=1 Tax=Acidithiobacillus marinus TaxID=187490 RepID=A0A2I1DL01_9PROT|nr:hypothetical protein [Acidithiobacillus marinus]PKY10526.1 hypothetical protein B1757_08045 [Acidithiobacillus marinus]
MSAPVESNVIIHFLAYADELIQTVADLPEIQQEQKQLYHVCLSSLWQILNNAFQQDGQQFLSAEQVQLLQMVDQEICHHEEEISADLRQQISRFLRDMSPDLVS